MALIQGGKHDDLMAEINITPFTDVLLVLLIIFMILASFVSPPGFEKSLPNHGTSTITDTKLKTKTIEVSVNAFGSIIVDDHPTTVVGIYALLAHEAKHRGAAACRNSGRRKSALRRHHPRTRCREACEARRRRLRDELGESETYGVYDEQSRR